MQSSTTPNVFIIESLRFKDEKRGHAEGRFLSHILKLADRKVRYVYIRTRVELDEVLDQFEDSGFRYLHLSCHANTDGIALTLDHLSVADMAEAYSSADHFVGLPTVSETQPAADRTNGTETVRNFSSNSAW